MHGSRSWPFRLFFHICWVSGRRWDGRHQGTEIFIKGGPAVLYAAKQFGKAMEKRKEEGQPLNTTAALRDAAQQIGKDLSLGGPHSRFFIRSLRQIPKQYHRSYAHLASSSPAPSVDPAADGMSQQHLDEVFADALCSLLSGKSSRVLGGPYELVGRTRTREGAACSWNFDGQE